MTITDTEVLAISSSIAKSFCSKTNKYPLEELTNEGFVAAKEALLANSTNPSYRYAISKRIKGAIIDFINSTKHVSLPVLEDDNIADIEDRSYDTKLDIYKIIEPSSVMKLIKLCVFYNEKRSLLKPLMGRGMELLWDRYVEGMKLKELSTKYNAAPQSIQIKLEDMIFQLRCVIETSAGRMKQ